MEYTIAFPENYQAPQLPGLTKWVEALRSGKYKQGQARLYDVEADSYCCLGLKCLLDGVLKIDEIQGYSYDISGSRYNWLYLAPENPLCSVFGNDGMFPPEVFVKRPFKETIGSLAKLNDEGFSFAEIADIIEQIWVEAQ